MVVQFGTYAHMCRDGHDQIGHRDSEHELCPLCRAISALETILMMHDGNQPAALNMPDLDYARRTIMSIHAEARAALATLTNGDN